VRLALLLVVPALAACPKKKDDGPKATDSVERPVPEARVTTPVPIHELLAYARSKAPGQPAWRISIDYVRPDGLIDPAYGEVHVWFGAPRARQPGDDPTRPTGAPVKPGPRPPPPTCHHLTWREGVWSDMVVGCSGATAAFEPKCPVPIIWERAIAKGAPRDAVAKLGLVTSGGAVRWTFVIEDKPRNVDFREMFLDDCGLVAEAPDPTVGPDTAVDGLDRKMIQNTIGTVKATVRACAEKAPAKGVVKVKVKVTPEGTSTVTVTEQPSEALGTCVKKAVEGAQFPPTRNGGSFSYPFMF
jgi:hypothetical protein